MKKAVFCLFFLLYWPMTSTAENALTNNLETLKQSVLQLNRDLYVLEEDLLFPASTQIALYLSLDSGQFFSLDSVEIRIDDQPAVAQLYTDLQLNALKKGGIQNLYKGNIKAGKHTLTAIFNGMGPDNRSYRRAVSYDFEKADEPVMLELIIKDRSADFQPDFLVEPWHLD